MPYIYTLNGMVNKNDYTMMRGLVMDFPNDTKVFDIKDQYMFGPSILVAPVTDAAVTKRNVYLPNGTKWINFWTGETIEGGKTISASAPLDKLPLFIKAGSIVPPREPPIATFIIIKKFLWNGNVVSELLKVKYKTSSK